VEVSTSNLDSPKLYQHYLWLIENAAADPKGASINFDYDYIVEIGPLSTSHEEFFNSPSTLEDLRIDIAAIVRIESDVEPVVIIAGMAPYATKRQRVALRQSQDLVELGKQLFTNETFGGNGRTCSTCHLINKGFTISPDDIRRFPPSHPLFVHRRVPALADLEDDDFLRQGLILENPNGFDEPAVFRAPPSVANALAPFGWHGHVGNLADFSHGAIVQHFPKTLAREPGVDFMVTQEQLDALAAFQNSVKSPKNKNLQENLERLVKRPDEVRGMEIFFDETRGKCAKCHSSATLGGTNNSDTGVADRPGHAGLPPDLGNGDGRFNIPQLFGTARTAPFFHDNSAATLTDAVEHYVTDAFNNSPGGKFVEGINLTSGEIADVVAFLEAISRP
jgi:cytochrome c peroxidase